MTYAYLFSDYEKRLVDKGIEKEALKFTYCQIKKLSLTDFVLQLQKEVSPEDSELLKTILDQLLHYIPPQYIIGSSQFYDLTLSVDRRVLIPRIETEELVSLILSENPSGQSMRVLDIGTGSGAIAIALAKHRPKWEVWASDISTDALDLATENAQKNQVSLQFLQSDVFSHISGEFDIIVSNPPYISEADKDEVDLTVLHSEPKLALFADHDGLAIYEKIIQEAQLHLTAQGKLYFEIGYKQGQAITQIAHRLLPNREVTILKDAFQKDRMVKIVNKATPK